MAEAIKTEKNKPKHVMQYPISMDYIAVVGARTRTWDPSLTGLRILSGKGNQYMFINQGILQLRLFPQATSDYKIQRILVVFQHGYTATDIQRINNYVKTLKARIIYIKTADELVEFLNSRIDKKRLVKQLVFVSHGLIGKISFRYEGDDEVSGEFNQQLVDKVNKLIFHYDAEVISYACRTGIGVDQESFKSSAEAQSEKSLAQYMANSWMVKVKAFEHRSLYANTYGTSA